MPASLVHFFHPVLHSVPSVIQSVLDRVAHGNTARKIRDDHSEGAFTTIHEGRIS